MGQIELRFRFIARALLVAVTVAAAACDAPTAPEPAHMAELGPTAANGLLWGNSGASELLACPSGTPRSQSVTVSPLGGVFNLLGHLLVVPEGALLGTQTLTLTESASPYMEVSLRMGGAEHFTFQLPVLVTISYARCPVGFFSPPLRVWNIDETTKGFLEDMGGFDNRLLRTVTFTTTHFSGYAVAQ